MFILFFILGSEKAQFSRQTHLDLEVLDGPAAIRVDARPPTGSQRSSDLGRRSRAARPVLTHPLHFFQSSIVIHARKVQLVQGLQRYVTGVMIRCLWHGGRTVLLGDGRCIVLDGKSQFSIAIWYKSFSHQFDLLFLLPACHEGKFKLTPLSNCHEAAARLKL